MFVFEQLLIYLKQLKMKKLLFSFIAIFVLCFSTNAQHLRADFLKGKTHKQVVESFSQLSESGQKELWLEKMDQLLSLKLPSQHHDLVKKIREGMDKGVDTESAPAFLKSASQLAKITPRQDFGEMFEMLEDYQYSGKFSGTENMPDSLVEGLADMDLFNRGACSCRWCLFGTTSTGTNCAPTKSGCGFLWIQECNQCILCR